MSPPNPLRHCRCIAPTLIVLVGLAAGLPGDVASQGSGRRAGGTIMLTCTVTRGATIPEKALISVSLR
jgi:hypothetical protein